MKKSISYVLCLTISSILFVVLFCSFINENKNLKKQLEELDKLPKLVDFCYSHENYLHFHRIKFNYFEAKFDVYMNNDGSCNWIRTILDYQKPSLGSFDIGNYDKNLCDNIKLKCDKLTFFK